MGRKRIKQYLMLLLAVGVIAVVASGSGTFASFTAETTNANNTFATGTLFLHNTKGTTTCTSESGTGNVQTTGCSTLFSVTNLNSNTPSTANLTLTNAGSLNSQNISFKAPGGSVCTDSAATIGTLSATPAVTDTSTSIGIVGLTQTLVKDTKITLTDGASNQTYNVTTTVASAGAAPAVTTVAVTPTTGTGAHTYATATTKITFSLGFTQTANLCSQLTIYIDVMTDNTFTTSSGCAYGTASGGAGAPCTSGTSLASLPSPLTNLNNIATPQLAAGASQYLRITVVPSLSITNAQQSTQASFDLTWHIAA